MTATVRAGNTKSPFSSFTVEAESKDVSCTFNPNFSEFLRKLALLYPRRPSLLLLDGDLPPFENLGLTSGDKFELGLAYAVNGFGEDYGKYSRLCSLVSEKSISGWPRDRLGSDMLVGD